jgi:protein-disulfide isomerase
MRSYLPLAIISAVLILAIGGGLMLFKRKQQQQPSQTSPIIPIVQETPSASETPSVSETPGGSQAPASSEAPRVSEAPDKPIPAKANSTPEQLHVRGGATARVTLEEYGDFQCQPCGRLFPVLTAAEHEYGNRLRVIFRHMPLKKHEHALLAARVAEAAGLQGRFWEMHDLLFQNSLRWTKGIDTVGPDAPPSRRLESNVLALDLEVRDVFFRYAEMLQLDVERFKQDLDSDQIKARVESDREKGAGLGIDRTPTVYLNGHLLPATTALSAEGLHAAIDAALNGKVYEPPASPSPAATPGPTK